MFTRINERRKETKVISVPQKQIERNSNIFLRTKKELRSPTVLLKIEQKIKFLKTHSFQALEFTYSSLINYSTRLVNYRYNNYRVQRFSDLTTR